MILIISDIHGNADALEAIWADAASKFKIKEVLCLGDLFTLGPDPIAVYDLVREFPGFKCLRGNHEDYLIDRIHEQKEGRIGQFEIGSDIYQRVKHSLFRTYNSLGDKKVDWLQGLVIDSHNIKIGSQRHHFCHGTLDSNMVGTHDHNVEVMLSRVDVDYLWAGHIHHQIIREVGRCKFINPGGSGMPFDELHSAPYAIIDEQGVPHLFRANYDYEKVVEKLSRIDDQFAEILSRHIAAAKLIRYPFL